MNDLNTRPSVFLVDDDPSVRTAFSRGLAAEGFNVRSWSSGETFLAEHDPQLPGCLVADVAMPGINGLQLQAALAARNCLRPIVFVTGKGNIPMSVQAMRAGAVNFLSKPVRLADLVVAIREAFDRDHAIREQSARHAAVNSCFMALTAREREVLNLIVAGKLNKQIAAQLGAAEKTIKVHRGRVMAKMQVRSVAELVTLTMQLN